MEAIQDFSGKESLFNYQSQYNVKEVASRMPLRKLIGKQTILMPERMAPSDNMQGSQTGPRQSRNANYQETMTQESQETVDKLSMTMMHQLVSDPKFAGKQSSQTVFE